MATKRTIGIVGTGMIASSMANLCTGHGFPTVVVARSDASIERLMKSYHTNFSSMIGHGVMTEQQAETCLTYLTVTKDYADLAECSVVFECIVENLDQKHEVYHLLENNCPKLEAICSVSSSIVPDLLAEGIDRYGDRIIVTHPFNPAHMVPYFELCAGSRTADGVVELVMDVLRQLDRQPVLLKKPTPGFIGNRLQFALLREAIRLVEEGIADPRDVDACLNYSFCPRYTSIGIFEHFDGGGMELCGTVCGNLFPIISDEKTVPKLITDNMAAGRMGIKAGKGFYDWEGVDLQAYKERVDAPYWKFCNWGFPEENNK